MEPTQLSSPTTCQPTWVAFAAVVAARPLMPELLKTSTYTSPRLIVGLGLGVFTGMTGVASAVSVGVTAAVVTLRSDGPASRVATKAKPAIAIAMMLSITSGEGKATPRWLRERCA